MRSGPPEQGGSEASTRSISLTCKSRCRRTFIRVTSSLLESMFFIRHFINLYVNDNMSISVDPQHSSSATCAVRGGPSRPEAQFEVSGQARDSEGEKDRVEPPLINQSMFSTLTLTFMRDTEENKQLCTRGVLQGQEREDNEFSMFSLAMG